MHYRSERFAYLTQTVVTAPPEIEPTQRPPVVLLLARSEPDVFAAHQHIDADARTRARVFVVAFARFFAAKIK